ncbi:DUF3085 domain-containing protein [Vibrio penaeicida]|uniref:DUF3085 domain-containing protein n=1 Tax=Vibrio penaeicida TaxID=104609 RepID=A0AAV5NKP7_9VIBR|nr:DUF3085 domain-containing protein [Vibrio penaeicida]RTZ24932.1 DUF3085 domain-containing protein [Vibrio penaeicida]GLQ71184.1 hypothetical protein GCM10007932_05440 [Vibrio penaeicida]
MSKLIFTRTQVQELSNFCNDNNLETFFLAKDNGIYIAATVGSNKDNTFKNCVQFAEGCDPDQDEAVYGDWYENARDLAGGDDIGEYLDVSILLDVLKQDNWKNFVITLTQTQLTISIAL